MQNALTADEVTRDNTIERNKRLGDSLLMVKTGISALLEKLSVIKLDKV